MSIYLLMLFVLALAGCSHPHGLSAPVEPAKSVVSQWGDGPQNVEAFQFIGPSTTMEEVMAKLGPPVSDYRARFHYLWYWLSDGSDVFICSGYEKWSRILWAAHGKTLLFEQK
jgi:hypothetical protein